MSTKLGKTSYTSYLPYTVAMACKYDSLTIIQTMYFFEQKAQLINNLKCNNDIGHSTEVKGRY